MTDMNAHSFLQAVDDGFVQVRDKDGRLLGCIPGELTSGTTVIPTQSGTVFAVGLFMNTAIRVEDGQDPHRIPNFIPNPNYKPLQGPVTKNETP